MGGVARGLTVFGAVGAGLSGGVFLAFSTFVMTALGRLPHRDGISAMQAINKAAPSPAGAVFMTTLFGTGAVCVGLLVVALPQRDEPWATPALIGSGLHLATLVLTVAYHVPRNDALALVDPSAPEAAATWARYLRDWTRWNHVRTLAGLGAAAAFALALTAE